MNFGDIGEWDDVTEEFKIAASTMDIGNLMHDNNFSLYEAMSAIEIMEPKMDSGLIYSKNSRKINTFASASEEKILILEEDVPMAHILFVIDHSYSSLVQWLEGYSFVQTIMINLYMHNPEKIKNKYLKVFVLSILKLSYFIKEIIKDAGTFEEEDFQASTYGFDLASSYSLMELINSLNELESNLSLKDKSYDTLDFNPVKWRLGFTSSLLLILGTYYRILQKYRNIQDISLISNCVTSLKAKPVINGVDTSIYRGCKKSLSNEDAIISNLNSYFSNITKSTKLIETSFIDGKLLVPFQKKYTESINSLVTDKNSLENDELISTLNQYLSNGFDPLVNLRLLPPTFPRDVKFIEPIEAYRYLYKNFTHYIQLSLTLIANKYNQEPHSNQDHFWNVLHFFANFEDLCTDTFVDDRSSEELSLDFLPSPCLLSRSILQITYSQILMKLPTRSSQLSSDNMAEPPPDTNKDYSVPRHSRHFMDRIHRSMRSFARGGIGSHSSKPESSPDSGHSSKINLNGNESTDDANDFDILNDDEVPEEVLIFTSNASNVCLAMIHVQGFDPARRRAKLAFLFRDLSFVLEEAERLDQYRTYKRLEKIRICPLEHDPLTTVGEPEYSPFCAWLLLSTMISYLLYGFELKLYGHYELPYIYWFLAQLYAQIRKVVLHTIPNPLSPPSNRPHDGLLNGTHSPFPSLEESEGFSFHVMATEFTAFHYLCKGYHECLAALLLDNQIDRPRFEFTTERIRFDHRMSVFDSISQKSPEWTYDNYWRQTHQTAPSCPSPLRDNIIHEGDGGSYLSLLSLYESAAHDFDVAKRAFDEVSKFPEAFGCHVPRLRHKSAHGSGFVAKVCRTNAIVCRIMASRARKVGMEIRKDTDPKPAPKLVTLDFKAAPAGSGKSYCSRGLESSLQHHFPILKIVPHPPVVAGSG